MALRKNRLVLAGFWLVAIAALAVFALAVRRGSPLAQAGNKLRDDGARMRTQIEMRTPDDEVSMSGKGVVSAERARVRAEFSRRDPGADDAETVKMTMLTLSVTT